jgi:hypothetical protein
MPLPLSYKPLPRPFTHYSSLIYNTCIHPKTCSVFPARGRLGTILPHGVLVADTHFCVSRFSKMLLTDARLEDELYCHVVDALRDSRYWQSLKGLKALLT